MGTNVIICHSTYELNVVIPAVKAPITISCWTRHITWSAYKMGTQRHI